MSQCLLQPIPFGRLTDCTSADQRQAVTDMRSNALERWTTQPGSAWSRACATAMNRDLCAKHSHICSFRRALARDIYAKLHASYSFQ